MQFQKATKKQAKLRLALMGPAGSGKTYTALRVACGLGERVALVDTEHGSASKYADLFDFDALELDAPFHPDRFVDAIRAAGEAGYDVLVLDSLSHAWSGPGGLLEIVDEIGKRSKSSNTFAAWKDATPIQNRLVEAILAARIHIIATMRTKVEYVVEQVERNGRTVTQPRKVGTAPIQRDQFDYEFDIVGELDADNNLIVTKTRCPALTGAVIARPGDELAATLRDWLGSGEPAADYETLQAIEALALSASITNAQRASLQGRMGSMTAREAAQAIAWLRERQPANGGEPEDGEPGDLFGGADRRAPNAVDH